MSALNFSHRYPSSANARTHNDAVANPHGVEKAILGILTSIHDYCRSYRYRCDYQNVGDDSILGDEGIKPMLKAVQVLLNGPTGRLDCGTIDTVLFDIARENGIDLES